LYLNELKIFLEGIAVLTNNYNYLLMNNYADLTNQTVTENYKEIIKNGLPFLQIFPQMFQDEQLKPSP
jgi:hypothetical protein